MDLGRSDGNKLVANGRRVVMGHALPFPIVSLMRSRSSLCVYTGEGGLFTRREGDVVACADLLAGCETQRVPLDNLLRQRLGVFDLGSGCVEEVGRGRGIFELRVKGILAGTGRRGVEARADRS